MGCGIMLMKDLFSKKTCVNGVQLVWLRKDVQQKLFKKMNLTKLNVLAVECAPTLVHSAHSRWKEEPF